MARNIWWGKQKKCKASETKDNPEIVDDEDNDDEEEEPKEHETGSSKK